MYKGILVGVALTACIGTLSGCTTSPTTFPTTANPEITTTEDFEHLA
jgi:hypothetical protein